MLATGKGIGTQEPPKTPLPTPRRLIALGVIVVVVLATVFVLTRSPSRVPEFMNCQAIALAVYEDVENPTRYSRDDLIHGALKTTLEGCFVKVTVEGNTDRFHGGHGVGLCQYGAEGMARSNKTSEKILAFYYLTARIERVLTFPENSTTRGQAT